MMQARRTWTVNATALLLLLGACTRGALDESLTDLEIGECVKDEGVGEVAELDRVPCTDPDAIPVVDKFDITGYNEFPGASTIDQLALDGCPADSTTYLAPTRESWEGAGDRLVICFE